MIGHAERTLSESVPAPPDAVREYCVDPANIATLHPQVSLRAVARTEADGTGDRELRVSDPISWGFLTVPLRYTVSLRVPVAGAVTAEAHPVPTVRLEAVIAFEPIPAGTRLKEYLRISAPRPVLGVVTRRAVGAHLVMLAGVRRHFETLGAGRRGD
ncbi:MAG: SRPBCC family protein [Mycobacterium sp.]